MYGLGCESQDLPAYMVLTDQVVCRWMVLPIGRTVLCRPCFKVRYQAARATYSELATTGPFSRQVPAAESRTAESTQQRLPGSASGEAELEARIASYELAARMQTAAAEALDISKESEATHRLYGIDRDETREYGTRLLDCSSIGRARRALRAVVPLGSTLGQSSIDCQVATGHLPQDDQPAAALVFDLKQRGMLDSTLVHWAARSVACRLPKNMVRRRKPVAITTGKALAFG